MSRSMMVHFLCLLAAAAVCQAAPTSSPSTAPTSAPTTAVIEDKEKEDLTKPGDKKDDKKDDMKDDKNETGVNGSNEIAVLPFTVEMTLPNVSAFNETDYLASIAAITGVNADAVTIVSVAFIVTTEYTFAADIAEDKMQEGIAANAGVAKADVTVKKLPASRRLRNGRRLQTSFKVLAEIKTADKTKVDGITAAAGNATTLAAALTTATGSTVAAPTVVPKPLKVAVETEVKSAPGKPAVKPPKKEEISKEMSDRSGVTIVASEPDVKPIKTIAVDTNTTTEAASTTSAPAGGENSAASMLSVGYVALMMIMAVCA